MSDTVLARLTALVTSLSLLSLGCSPSEIATPPSVIVLAIDTLAAEHMSLYGYERPTTPFLEQLATESIVFDRCTAAAPWTLPSFLALLSGLHAESHLVAAPDPAQPDDELAVYGHWRLHDSCETLAESLAAAGYRTAAFTDVAWLTAGYGVAQGFDQFDSSGGGFDTLAKRATEWLRSVEQPSFLFLHAYDVHAPYTAEVEWRAALGPRTESNGADVTTGGKGGTYGVIPEYVARGEYGAAIPKRIPTGPLIDAYDAGVRRIDARIEAWMERLESLDVLDNTIVVLTSDHGEAMLEEQWYFKHSAMYESVLHVPLLVRLPDAEHGGRRIATRVSGVDLMPTLLELCAVERDASSLHGDSLHGDSLHGDSLHGRSLVAALRGESLEPQPVYAGAGVLGGEAVLDGDHKLLRLRPARGPLWTALSWPGLRRAWLQEHAPELLDVALTRERYEGVVARLGVERLGDLLAEELAESRIQLFDLESESGESRDLAAERKAVVAQLERVLNAERERAQRSRAHSTEGGTELSPELRQALIEAGYLDD